MNTKMENGIQMTLEMWMPEAFQKPIAGVSERLVKTSLLQGNGRGLTETEAPSLEKYLESLGKLKKKVDLNGLSTKMLRECLAATEDLTTLKFSLRWMDWGTIANGSFSTQKIGECHRTESACILSDILEAEAPQKYFLSREQMERIVFSN